ncbi:T9SS type A sorting domain-containing protein, partial [Carboxylicivirga sp. RSCT41]|uniref:T9SS type A sorting domain-containing protein n=1 Tax=Carboxylicivirga agarovorans TaxID=3417570 RepID=UPI003D348262
VGGPMITLDPVRSFAFVIYDSSVPAGPMGGNELDGATVELTDGVSTYTATSAMGGFADFADVKFGTYDYTVSMAGYGTVTGSFEVTAETGVTVGGPMITLDPVRSFAFVIYDSSVPAGPMGGNELDGATVELTDGVSTYTATSAMGGFADFADVKFGTYDYTVSMAGYGTVTGTFEVTAETGITVGGPMITLDPVRSFAFVIYDSSVPAGPMGGNELDGATVELTDGSNTYTATSAMGGFADFADVKFGTYDYTVSMAGYGTVTGTFEVTAETGITVGGPMITLDPVRSFAFVIYDSSVPAGPMGGNELDGATVELTDGSNTYTATSAMGGFADFADVKFGTYDYTVSMSGYVTVTGTFEVTSETGITVGGPTVTLDPIATSIDNTSAAKLLIYPNPASSEINVELGIVEGLVIISVINSNGTVVNQFETTQSINNIDLNALSNGIYFINVNGGVYNRTIKFVKQ